MKTIKKGISNIKQGMPKDKVLWRRKTTSAFDILHSIFFSSNAFISSPPAGNIASLGNVPFSGFRLQAGGDR
jgi:hypothetical protein